MKPPPSSPSASREPSRRVDFVVEVEPPGVDLASLQALAARALAGEGVAGGLTLTVLMTDDAALQELNRRFLGVDAPTDVLAFPEGEAPAGEDAPPALGEIAISAPTAARQAAAAGRALEDELAHLLIHGVLHLCGYEHEAGGEAAARMRAREEEYLGAIHAPERPPPA